MPEVHLHVQLLPVTKVQFERFLAEPNEFGDAWYEQVLAVNPRVSYQEFTDKNRESIFITGILAEEAEAFARWMEQDFRLPTIQEWRMVYQALAKRGVTPEERQQWLTACHTLQAQIIVQGVLAQLKPTSWLDLTLMRGGRVEWVHGDGGYVGLGAPRGEFHPNLWNPLVDVVRPLRSDTRLSYFGFRLMRKGSTT